MIILLIILAVIAIILLMPVRFELDYNKDELSDNASVVVKYAFIKYSIYPKKEKKEKSESDSKSEAVTDSEAVEKAENSEKKEFKEKKESFSFKRMKSELEGFLKFLNSIKSDCIKILSYAAKHAVIIDKIAYSSEFGFDNAMHTGIFTGIYNGAVYSVLGVIHHNSHLRAMDINLQPVYGKKCFNYRFSCILRIKTVHIIIIAFKVLILLRKIKKL